MVSIRCVVDPSGAQPTPPSARKCPRPLLDDELERVLNALHESFNYSAHTLSARVAVTHPAEYFYSRLGSTELSKELLRSHIVSALLEPAGEVWVAELDDTSRAVVGVAVWFGPGAKYLRT